MDPLLKLFFFFFQASFLLILTSTTGGNGNSLLLLTHPPPQHAHPEPIAAAAVSDLRFDDAVLLLSIPNGLLPPLASNHTLAVHWLRDHFLPFHPRSKIAIISFGNDAVAVSVSQLQFLLPAIRNLHLALREIGTRTISVSTTFSFVNNLTTTAIRPLLQFLEDTNSSFLIRKDIKIHEFVESGHNWGILNPNYTITKHQLESSSVTKICAIASRILFLILFSSLWLLNFPGMPYKRHIVQVSLLGISFYAMLNALVHLGGSECKTRRQRQRDRQQVRPIWQRVMIVAMLSVAMAAVVGLAVIDTMPDFLAD